MAFENIKILDWNRAKGKIDTSGTDYVLNSLGDGVWILKGNEELLHSEGLKKFEDFTALRGEVVDVNPQSQVHRIRLGPNKKIFYLKLHKNYVRSSLKTLFRPLPMVMKELSNLMRYARLGFDSLEPVAWGWRPAMGGGDSFLLISNLENFRSLSDWLSDSTVVSNLSKRREIRKALKEMLSLIHRGGIAHVDLFSWHIFLKQTDNGFITQPIDLERTRIKGHWPWSPWRFYKKKISDLAVLHLTVPFPEVGYGERLNFFLDYRGHKRLTFMDRRLLKMITKEAKRRGKKSKFRPYGVVDNLNGQTGV
jgi:hypothetical protein